MPSSDRFEPRDDLPGPDLREDDKSADRARKAASPAHPAAEPPEFFDPSEPWDLQCAEALTRLCESEEGGLWRHHEGERARRSAAPDAARHADAAAPMTGAYGLDGPGLEPRLAGLVQQLQDTLAALDPGQTLAPLNRRLDAIEERLAEALSGVAQRSDVEGLRLIEAQVMELAAHVQQNGSRLDRLDAMDGQMRELARKFDEGGLQRLEALEAVLQNYVAEWRRSDERTSSTLGVLDETLTRIGDSIDAAEALKPAPDLSLAAFAAGEPESPRLESDPLSQVYADGARALAPKYHHATLDAADYSARPPGFSGSPEPEDELPLTREAAFGPRGSVEDEAATAPERPAAVSDAAAPLTGNAPALGPESTLGSELAPPAFRASAIRARLRQIQMLSPETAGAPGPSARLLHADAASDAADGNTKRRSRPGLLLAAGFTLFAAAGYLLVDVFLTTPATSPRTPGLEQGTAPPSTGGKHAEAMQRRDVNAAPKQPGRIDAIGAALAAMLRDAPPVATPVLHKEGSPPADEAISTLINPPALTIGPASLRQAAMNGDPAAQYEVGARYAAGRGVSQDLGEALRWFSRAAARGLAPAQFRLAAMHEHGMGTAADAEKARAWYLRAAQRGHVKAMHNLAVLSVGSGRSDYATGAKWFAQAAERGLADSQFNLAVLYQSGLGVTKDLKQAYQWLALAARGGDREAAARVALIKSQLAPTDQQAADATVAAWRVRAPDPAANDAAASSLGGQ